MLEDNITASYYRFVNGTCKYLTKRKINHDFFYSYIKLETLDKYLKFLNFRKIFLFKINFRPFFFSQKWFNASANSKLSFV